MGYVIPPAERVRDGQARYRLVRRSDCGGPGNSVSDVAAGPSNDFRVNTTVLPGDTNETAVRPCQDNERAGEGHSPLPAPRVVSRGGRSEPLDRDPAAAISRCPNPYEYEAEEAA